LHLISIFIASCSLAKHQVGGHWAHVVVLQAQMPIQFNKVYNRLQYRLVSQILRV